MSIFTSLLLMRNFNSECFSKSIWAYTTVTVWQSQDSEPVVSDAEAGLVFSELTCFPFI